MDVRVGLWRKLSTKELTLLNCGVETLLDCKEVQPVHPKGDQSCVFIGRTDAEADTPILRPPNVKSWLIGKYPDARKDWGCEEKGTTEGEMVGLHCWLSGHEFELTLWVGDGQGGLCAEVYGVSKSRTWLRNWTKLNWNRPQSPYKICLEKLMVLKHEFDFLLYFSMGYEIILSVCMMC